MISSHRTEKLVSMGFEILGLERERVKFIAFPNPLVISCLILCREGKEMNKKPRFVVLLTKAIVF